MKKLLLPIYPQRAPFLGLLHSFCLHPKNFIFSYGEYKEVKIQNEYGQVMNNLELTVYGQSNLKILCYIFH